MDLTGLRKYLKSEHIFHQDFWNPRGEERMKTQQTDLKWQVLHFSCSTLEIRYLILTEVIIFITPIKEVNTCHLPDFWEGLNFPLCRGGYIALAGGKCHYFIEWCLFYLPRRLYLEESVLCTGRNKLSLLDQKQRQQPLNPAGPDVLFGEDGRQLPYSLLIPRMTFPAAAWLLEVEEVRMLGIAPWGSAFPLALLLSHSLTLGK